MQDAMFLWDGGNGKDAKMTLHLNGKGPTGKGEIQSNAGFWFARNTPTTRKWFAYVSKKMNEEAEARKVCL